MKKILLYIVSGLVMALTVGLVLYPSLSTILSPPKPTSPFDIYIQEADSRNAFLTIVQVGVPLIIGISFAYGIYSSNRERAKTEQSRTELKTEEKEYVQELKQGDTSFAALWILTQGRIDYYHKIARDQARRSFLSSQIATAAGFALIIGVALIAARATDPVAAIAVSAVGVVGGGLSAYIGATFVKAQAEATAQLRQFFMQPVEFSRMLGAERLLDNLGTEQKSEAVQQIIKSLMFNQGFERDK